MTDLKKMCNSYADDITNGELALSEYDFIDNCLDIRYIVDSKCQYLGAELLVSFGGPNIWVHTIDNTVRGYWASDKETVIYTDNIGLNDMCAEIYSENVRYRGAK